MKWWVSMGILASCAAYAADSTALNFLGFSASGEVLAFETYGIKDGSGFPYSTLYTVNTTSNTWRYAPYAVLLKNDGATLSQARGKVQQAAQKVINTYTIRPQQGLLQALNCNQNICSVGRTSLELQYQLRSGGLPKACSHLKDMPVNGVNTTQLLTLNITNTLTHKTKTLQQDKTLPATRGCAAGYIPDKVYLYKNTIAVFFKVMSPGFEGVNQSHMVVTGVLP